MTSHRHTPRAQRAAWCGTLSRLAVAGAASLAMLAGASASASSPPPSTAGGSPAPVPSGTTAAAAIGGARLAEVGVVVAPGVPAPPVNEAVSYVVADVDSGDVLAAKAAHQAELPASTLKILTALTLLPELDPTEVVVGTDDAAAVEGSKAGIYPGLKYSIDLVFKAMLLQSGNDAAVTLALAGGGVKPTVAAMNAVAEDLHALDTVAVNTSGLDAPGQLTSAYDLALITRAALAREDFRTYVTTQTADMPDVTGATYQIQNENRFLADYDGAIGVKNGYTTLARHTFVGAAERGGRTLVVTVMKTEGRPEPIVAALMDWGFANAATADPVAQLIGPSDDIALTPAVSPSASDEAHGDSEPQPASSKAAVAQDDAATTAIRSSDSGRSGVETAAILLLGAATIAAVLRARGAWRQRTAGRQRPAGGR